MESDLKTFATVAALLTLYAGVGIGAGSQNHSPAPGHQAGRKLQSGNPGGRRPSPLRQAGEDAAGKSPATFEAEVQQALETSASC